MTADHRDLVIAPRVDEIRWTLEPEPAAPEQQPSSRVREMIASVAKRVICRAINACPCRHHRRLLAVARRVFPGFRDA